MAWSDAARRAAALARKLRSQLRPQDRPAGRRLQFKKFRASAEMDRVVQSGGTLTISDPAMIRYGSASRQLNRLKNRGQPAKLARRLDRIRGQEFKNKQQRQRTAALRTKMRMDQAYEDSIKAGLNAGKKRGGF